jgi:hypothetical protein
MKKYLIIAAAAVLLVAAGIGLRAYFKPHKDFGASPPDVVIAAKDLIKEFETDESSANRKFVADDKTVQVSGVVSDITRRPDGGITLMLGDAGTEGGINCTLTGEQNAAADGVKKGETITIKGQCTGYQQLIDSEVIMIRCAIVK